MLQIASIIAYLKNKFLLSFRISLKSISAVGSPLPYRGNGNAIPVVYEWFPLTGYGDMHHFPNSLVGKPKVQQSSEIENPGIA